MNGNSVREKSLLCQGEMENDILFHCPLYDEPTNNLHSKLTFISSQLNRYENVEKSVTMKQIFFLPHLICKTKGNPIKRETAKASIDLCGA